MVNYRRNRVPGGTFFFTVTLMDRRSRVLVEYIHLLREAMRAVRRSLAFRVNAVVVLPDHLHTVWTLPPGDNDFPARWKAIKSAFTRAVVKAGLDLPWNKKGEYSLWRRRYREHTIRDSDDLQRHVDYIHFNPVKHGLVRRVADWPHSSFHHYVRAGILPLDWAGGTDDTRNVECGE